MPPWLRKSAAAVERPMPRPQKKVKRTTYLGLGQSGIPGFRCWIRHLARIHPGLHPENSTTHDVVCGGNAGHLADLVHLAPTTGAL